MSDDSHTPTGRLSNAQPGLQPKDTKSITGVTAQHIRESNLIESVDDGLQDARMLDAWEYLSKQKRISQPVLLELHRGITIDQLPTKESGHYRTASVWVGGYAAPAPMVAQGQMYGWIMDLQQHWQTLDPKEMHVRFEKIHPFIDGNGRTGRMLMWWHEIKLGREPTLILNDTKFTDYYPWFREAKKEVTT